RPLRERDKIFSFDLGSTLIGGQLGARKSEFDYGDRLIAQCLLNPPHEDLWIDIALLDGQDRTIERSGQVATRDMLHTSFVYNIGNSLVPGDYSMVLHTNGKEVARRQFKIIGDPESLPQMDLLSN
ncbi:MAG: hypothetical protein KDA85_08255, partial [Planctomycetaceae bacterium]|nr:hypothetical protein [Planctomycetaceae bacterium]